MSIIVNIQKVLWALNGLGKVTLQPDFMTLFLLLMAATSQKVGYSKYRSSLDPVGWGELFGRLPFYALLGVAIYLAVFLYCRKRRLRHEQFCVQCEKVVTRKAVEQCSCGGEVGYLADYKYAKEQESTN